MDGGQRTELRLSDLRCSAFLFSRSGELLSCNIPAKTSGYYQHGQTFEGLLGQLGLGATSSQPAFASQLALTGVWSSAWSLQGACLGASPSASSTLSVYLIDGDGEGAGDYLVLFATEPFTLQARKVSPAADTAAAAAAASNTGGAAEQRLREQLQTLQRKLMKTVAENEELATRLAGLRSVCLELTEQLTDADATRPLDRGTRHHLLHLTSTAASYCEMPAGGGGGDSAGLGRHSSSGRLRDLVDLDAAVTAAAAAAAAAAAVAGAAVSSSGRGQPTPTATASAAAAAAAAAGPAVCCAASCGAPGVADADAGSGSGQGLISGSSADDGSLVTTAVGAPGAVDSGAAGSCSAADYASLMDSFMALKASYDVLLQQQDALMESEAAAALSSPARLPAAPAPKAPQVVQVQQAEVPCRPISPNNQHRASLMSSAPIVAMAHMGLGRRGSITGLMCLGMEGGAGAGGGGAATAALSADLRLGSFNGEGIDTQAAAQDNLSNNNLSAMLDGGLSLADASSSLHGTDCGGVGATATASPRSLLHKGLSSVASSSVGVGELERLAAHARALKASCDVMQLQRDRAVSAATVQKVTFDRALAVAQHEADVVAGSAAATKAQFDKFVLDKAEEKAAFDHVLAQTAAEASQQKAIADKALVDFGELQANATAAKAQFDKFVLDKAEEKAAFDHVLEKTAAEASQQKAIADKALVDFGELQAAATADKAVHDKALYDVQANATAAKAQFDKFVLDKAEEKAAFDHVLAQTAAEASQQKAIADKALVDFGELQANAVADKAAHDMCLLDLQANAAADKAVHDKALYDVQANATAAKAQFDKFVLDKAEEKAAFDHVLAQTAAEASQQKAIADKALVDFGELQANAAADKAVHDKALYDVQANATAAKAQFDKFVLDKAEEKAAFDHVLEKTAAEASQQKAIADKALVDFGELQAHAAADKAVHDKALVDVQASATATKAQFDKFVLDKAEEKATFDAVLEKTAAEASQQKAIADKALVDFGELQATATADKAVHDKALYDVQANATAAKAQFDKFVLDKAEEKAAFDQVLEKTAAEASQQKAIADKALVDFGELQANAAADKAVHDKALYDVQANATATKAQFDKFVLDKAEEKAAFDAVLEQTAAEASQQKAIADKALVDFGELQATATADKAVHDKAIHDIQESAASTKAQFDKFVLDKAEEKATFDAVLEQTAAEASQQKAIADKALVDFGELQQTADAAKAQFDKLVADTAEEKAAFDVALGRAAEEAAEHQRRADFMRAEAEATAARLASERQHLDNLQAQNERLLKQQEVLQAELAMALRSYTPRTVIDAGTPADKMLAMMTDLLDGTPPTIQDILFVQSALLEAHDVYKPVNLGKQLLASGALDKDVGLSLLQQLGSQGEADEATRAANAANAPGGNSRAGGPGAAPGGAANGGGEALTLRDFGTRDGVSRAVSTPQQPMSPSAGSCESSLGGEAGRGGGGAAAAAVCWDTLESALTAIMAPAAPLEEGLDAVEDGAGGCVDGFACLSSGAASGPLGGGAAAAPGTPRAAARAMAAALDRQDGGSGRLLMRAVSSASRSMHARARAGSVSAGQLVLCSGAGGLGSGLGGAGGSGLLLLPGQSPLERANTTASQATTRTELCELDEFPELPLYTEVERVLSGGAGSWQWDAFKLANASADHALSSLGFYLFHQSDLIRKFELRPHQLACFLRRVEDGYRGNPYHSKTHAADVLQSLHVLVHRGGLAPGYVDPLSLMACYLAAIIHDFEHGGLTNDYLINSGDELALRYNDRAPLENHHCAAAFLLLRRPEYAFMAHLPKADTDRLRKMVIELVLATDMKQHFAIMSHFTTVHRLSTAASVTPSLMSGDRRRSGSNASSINSLACSGSGVEMDKILIPLDENERILSLQMALKCSDIGHVCASLPVHLRWVAALEEEFFRQGDMEKAHSLPVSPLFDRAKPGITKSQVGFFDIVVIPLLSNFSRVFTNAKPLLTYTMRNYKYWSEAQKSEQQVAAATAAASANGGR